jgi:hypothetical protein
MFLSMCWCRQAAVHSGVTGQETSTYLAWCSACASMRREAARTGGVQQLAPGALVLCWSVNFGTSYIGLHNVLFQRQASQ